MTVANPAVNDAAPQDLSSGLVRAVIDPKAYGSGGRIIGVHQPEIR